MRRWICVATLFAAGCYVWENEGYRAAKLGIPATANPYAGSRDHVLESKMWLEGYEKYVEEHGGGAK